MSRGRRSLWLAGYAVATFLAFPQRFGDLRFDLGVAAAWLPPALLILGLRGLAPRAAAKHAFLAGIAAHALVFQWLYVATVYYGDAPALVGVVVPIALAIYPALFVAVFAGSGAASARPVSVRRSRRRCCGSPSSGRAPSC